MLAPRVLAGVDVLYNTTTTVKNADAAILQEIAPERRNARGAAGKSAK
jgi:hypothetical protein